DSPRHKGGDRWRVTVATALRACRRHDETAARLGGDEFTVLLGEVADARDAAAVAERILAALREPIVLQGHELVLSVSIGIVVSQPGHDTTETLLRDADLAMYRAKTAGRGRYEIFDPSMGASAV